MTSAPEARAQTYASGTADATSVVGGTGAIGTSNSVVSGQGATGSNNSVVLGDGASGDSGSVAIGRGANALAGNAIAIGSGVTAAANQIVIGTGSQSLNAAGIVAQTGSLTTDRLVTIDGSGNLASVPATSLTNSIAQTNGRFDQVFQGLDKVSEGVAIAMATEAPDLTGDESFAMRLNFGTFDGEYALAISTVGVLSRNLFQRGGRLSVDLGAGFGINHQNIAGRAGLQVSW